LNDKWHEIWEKRNTDSNILFEEGDVQKIFLELKRINGWDSMDNKLSYEQFYGQYIQIKNELEFNSKISDNVVKSIFEIGCGAGANLYLFESEGIHVGGIDYSRTLIEIAKTILNSPIELLCDEAVNVPVDITYDAILSNSVFSYFDSYKYAQKVLEAMINKAKYSIGIIDIHDFKKKEAFLEFRKSIVKDYEERYRDLPKFFYDKEFFLKFAEEHNMNIRFSISDMDGYWNNDFVFNCYMTKNY